MQQIKRLSMLMIIICGLMTAHSGFAADTEGNYAVWGVGSKSCFKYTQAREADDYDNYTSYIKGFLTAFNMVTEDTYSITGRMTFPQILEEMDDYCELKQINALEQGLLELLAIAEDKRTKTPKKGAGR